LPDVEEAVIHRYLSGFHRRPSGSLTNASGGLTPLVNLLRHKGVAADSKVPLPPTAIDHWLARFEGHLKQVQGTAPITVQKYRPFVRRFVSSYFDRGEESWRQLEAGDIADFVCQEVETEPVRGARHRALPSGFFYVF
jgi:hypothetical protein